MKLDLPRHNLPNRFLPWIAAVAGGILTFLGYAGFDRFYLEWICLVPVLWAIREQTPGRAFQLGWVAGIVAHCGGFYWIIHMFSEFAGVGWLPATLGLLILAAANGMVFAAWAWATRLVCRDAGWNVVWVSPVVWTAAEKLWPEIFPNYLGASQYKLSLMTQFADITGILGVTFLVVYANSTIYKVIERRLDKQPFPLRSTATFAAVTSLLLAYGTIRISTVDTLSSEAEKLTVGMVQANIGAGEKHNSPEYFLREHRLMSRGLVNTRPIDLIIWPESVFGVNLSSREGAFSPEFLGDLRTPMLFGTVLRLEQGGVRQAYNSAVLVNDSGRILGTYDKIVLVPFGEYIPFGDTFTRLYSWSPYTSRFRKGENEAPLMLGNHPISVSICYEDIYPGQIRTLMQGGPEKRIPEAMFNLSNDSWYGNTVEPMEHLALASFRAIEHRRTLVRATNTGVSAIVDPAGRIVLHSGQWTKEMIVGRIAMMRGRTVYALLGDWLGWACALIVFSGIILAFRSTGLLPLRRGGFAAKGRGAAKQRDKGSGIP